MSFRARRYRSSHSQEDAPVAAAFAEHRDLVRDAHAVVGIDRMRIELELVAIERHQLRHAASRGGEELEERAVAEPVVRRRVEALEKALQLLLIKMPGVRARVGGLGELDFLGSRNWQVEQDAELEQPAERDEVKVLRGGRNWSLASVPAREEPAARQVAPVGLQDPDVDVFEPGLGTVTLHEPQELHEKAFVPRKRRLAAALVAQLL